MIIYSSTGVQRAEVKKFTYHDTFMGECYLDAELESPSPVAFEIGDYCDYRTERFYLNYVPAVEKTARNSSRGDSFKYTSMKMNPASDELSRRLFLDIVSNDNGLTWTGLPDANFYCSSAQTLADRILANMNESYTGDQAWTINVITENLKDANEVLCTESGNDPIDATLSLSNKSCMEALAELYNTFRVTYIIRGRVITVAPSGTSVGATFGYGKGNGIYDLQQTTKQDSLIVTRLFCYGSTKNIATKYYAQLTGKGITSASQISPTYERTYLGVTYGFLMTLNFPFGAKYYRNKIFSTGETLIQNYYSVKLKSGNYEVSAIMTNGIDGDTGVYAQINKADPNYANFTASVSVGSTIYVTTGLYLDLLSSEYVSYDSNISDNLAVNHLMLPDFPLVTNNPSEVYIDSENISKLGVRQAEVFFDGSDAQHPEIYPTISYMTVAQVEAAGISLSIKENDNGRLDEIYSCDNPTDDGTIPTTSDSSYSTWQSTFKIYIKDLGFDLTLKSGDNYYYASSDKMQISMISGNCTGRTFDINKIEKDTTLGYTRYVFTCTRIQDTNINKAYPYSSYKINADDMFVLVNTKLPDVYVKAASQKLLSYGRAYLAKNDETKYTYTIKIDEIWMNDHPSVSNIIKAGDLFDFTDTDLSLDENVFIKTVTITEGSKLLPSYDITLDDDVESTTIQKIQNSITSISSGSGLSKDSVQSLIATYGGNYYLSKLKDDTAAGNMIFLKDVGIRGLLSVDNIKLNGSIVSDTFTSGLAGNGFKLWNDSDVWNMEIDTLTVRKVMTIFELIISKLRSVNGGMVISPANGKIKSVSYAGGVYTLEIDGDMSFAENDLIRCQTFRTTNSKYYWAKVESVTDHTITVNAINLDPDNTFPYTLPIEFSNCLPEVGDELVQMGNTTNTARQGALYLVASEDGKPRIEVLNGLNSASTTGKLKATFGDLDGIVDTDFPSISGYGLYAQNVYLKGILNVIGGSKLGALNVSADGSISNGTAFSLDSTGKLICNNAELSGKIISNTGNIGPFVISSSQLSATVGNEESDRLTFRSGVTTNGTQAIILDGVSFAIPVTTNQSTPILLAAHVASKSYEDWTVNYSTGNDYVDFTSRYSGSRSAPSFNPNSTGAVGIFTVNSAGTTNEQLILNASLIRFNNSDNYIWMGGDVMPSTTGGALSCPARIESNRIPTSGEYANACMYLYCTGAPAYDSEVMTGNHALYIPKGNICGFRLRMRRFTESANPFQITNMDSILRGISNGGSDYAANLPTDAEDGQVILVRKSGIANMWIGGTIQDGFAGTQSSVEITNSQLHIFIYDATNSVWTHNYMNN